MVEQSTDKRWNGIYSFSFSTQPLKHCSMLEWWTFLKNVFWLLLYTYTKCTYVWQTTVHPCRKSEHAYLNDSYIDSNYHDWGIISYHSIAYAPWDVDESWQRLVLCRRRIQPRPFGENRGENRRHIRSDKHGQGVLHWAFQARTRRGEWNPHCACAPGVKNSQ